MSKGGRVKSSVIIPKKTKDNMAHVSHKGNVEFDEMESEINQARSSAVDNGKQKICRNLNKDFSKDVNEGNTTGNQEKETNDSHSKSDQGNSRTTNLNKKSAITRSRSKASNAVQRTVADALQYLNRVANGNKKQIDFSLSGTSILPNPAVNIIDKEQQSSVLIADSSRMADDDDDDLDLEDEAERKRRRKIQDKKDKKRKRMELSSSGDRSDNDTPQDSKKRRSRKGRYRSRSKGRSHSQSSLDSRSRSRSGSRRRKKRRQKKRRRSSSSSSSSSSESEGRSKSKSMAELVKAAVSEQMAELKQCIMDSKGIEQNDRNVVEKSKQATPIQKIKSPSMDTIYEPAVQKRVQEGFIPPTAKNVLTPTSDVDPDINNVTNFINQIRLGVSGRESTSKNSEGGNATKRVPNELELARQAVEKEAREAADRAIVDAEKFKAILNTPKGRSGVSDILNPNIKPNQQLDDDDVFFHSTCHVESSLEDKCKKGQFVDLDKLLPKNMLFDDGPDQGLKMVNVNGSLILKPNEQSGKVTGIRSWDRAFRAYSTIYCRENPHRASEMLQYAAIINQAAQKFSWEDVAHYDYVFRHLMEKRPQRSWAKTYTQMWNITLCGQNKPARQSGGNTANRQSTGSWKDRCCWRYNKSRCKYGTECRYDHRCNYCGSFSHPSQNCPKKKRNSSGSEDTHHHSSGSRKKSKRHERSRSDDREA